MQCPESLRLQAYFDGEVDAVTSTDIERHMGQCAECRALHQGLEQLRSALRRDLPYAQAPPALRARIMQGLDDEGGSHAPQAQRAAPGPALCPGAARAARSDHAGPR